MNPKKRFLRYLFFFLAAFLLINGLLAAFLNRTYPIPLGPKFSVLEIKPKSTFKQMELHDLILVGDSTLEASIDAEKLAAGLELRVAQFPDFGSGSTLWFLIEKNWISTLNYPPSNLVFFFRDTMLTASDYAVSDLMIKRINDYIQKDDFPLVKNLSYINHMSVLQKVENRLVPILGDDYRIRNKLESTAQTLLPRLIFNESEDEVEADTDAQFAAGGRIYSLYVHYIDQLVSALYTPQHLDFAAEVQNSYLPLMIQEAKNNGMRVIFVRLKTLDSPSKTPVQAELREYGVDLAAYLKANHVPYLDFSENVELTPDLFFDPIHMNQAGKEKFTQIFLEAIAPLLK